MSGYIKGYDNGGKNLFLRWQHIGKLSRHLEQNLKNAQYENS